MRKPWETYREVIKKSWKCPKNIMRKSWESHGEVLQNSWGNHEKVMRKLWESHMKAMRQPWESLLLYSSCILCTHVCSCIFSYSTINWEQGAILPGLAFQAKAMVRIPHTGDKESLIPKNPAYGRH